MPETLLLVDAADAAAALTEAVADQLEAAIVTDEPSLGWLVDQLGLDEALCLTVAELRDRIAVDTGLLAFVQPNWN